MQPRSAWLRSAGRVRAEAADTAPISGRPCVYWRAEVECRQKKNEHGRTSQWITFAEDQSPPGRCFELEDETGKVLIWPWNVSVMSVQKETWESEQAAALARNSPSSFLQGAAKKIVAQSDKDLRLTEERIEIGEIVYVMGTLSERRHVRKWENLWSKVRNKFKGVAVARTMAQQHSGFREIGILLYAVVMVVQMLVGGRDLFLHPRRDSVESASDPPNVDPHQVLIWRGNRECPFIIADRPEALVMKTLTWQTTAGLLGGAALMIGSLLVLL